MRWKAFPQTATGNALSPTEDRRVPRPSKDVDEAERTLPGHKLVTKMAAVCKMCNNKY